MKSSGYRIPAHDLAIESLAGQRHLILPDHGEHTASVLAVLG